MREHTIEHVFAVDPQRFWRMFLLDEGFREGFYSHLRLDIERLEVHVSGEGEQLRIERTIEMTPRREVPGVLDKLLRGARTVREHGRYDARARRFDVEVTLPVIGKRVDFGGSYSWPASDRETRRTWRGRVHARIPLVGGRFEAYLLSELEKSMVQNHAFCARYITEQLEDVAAAS